MEEKEKKGRKKREGWRGRERGERWMLKKKKKKKRRDGGQK